MNGQTYGPVTITIRAGIRECQEEVDRLRDRLTWSWLRRRRHQVDRAEIVRCIEANEQRVSALRWAEGVAMDIENRSVQLHPAAFSPCAVHHNLCCGLCTPQIAQR